MSNKNVMQQKKYIGVAVDLGSTTIAVSCFDLDMKKELTSFSYGNPQTAYGLDVITRIRKCTDEPEMLEVLGNHVKKSLKEQLSGHLAELSKGQECDILQCIEKIVISGNTTMLHILRGLTVEGLALAPFKPATLDYAEDNECIDSFFSNEGHLDIKNNALKNITVAYPPGFSAFVGADILTGVEFLGMGKNEGYDLLIDLGTNGEMVLINKDVGYATSTACGPVFDNAVTGAAYGSECIKAIANCIKGRLIDGNGLIAKPYFDRGITIDKGFVIKQEHVRNFQLAKGAIYAGVLCLMEKAGITADNIENVYISGGLGFYMDVRDAFTVKMLPVELKNKIRISGNTSLNGAKKLVLEDEDGLSKIRQEYEMIRNRTESFEISDYNGFQDRFVAGMNF